MVDNNKEVVLAVTTEKDEKMQIEINPTTGAIIESAIVRAKGLADLRIAITAEQKKDKKFILVRDDDDFLVAFLRCKKYHIDKAIKSLKGFCKFWWASPTVVNGLCAAEIRRVYELDFLRVLNTVDIHGNMVIKKFCFI